MAAKTYPRKFLLQYGVTDAHRFVCEWIADDHQSAMVVGLGATEDEARADAEESAARGEYPIDGGSLVVAPIEPTNTAAVALGRLGGKSKSKAKAAAGRANGAKGGRPASATYYTCEGSVRGRCGVRHRTLRGAAACCARDHQGCASQGGYSDRIPGVVEAGVERPLTEDERDEYQAYRDGA